MKFSKFLIILLLSGLASQLNSEMRIDNITPYTLYILPHGWATTPDNLGIEIKPRSMIIGRSDEEIASKGLGLIDNRFETFPIKSLENGFMIRYNKPKQMDILGLHSNSSIKKAVSKKKKHVKFNDEEQPGAR